MLLFSLLGYAVLGRGFAYVGYSPLYIGEMLLLSGAAVFLWTGAWGALLHLRWVSLWPLALLGLWGSYRTLPYVAVHGMDALRDAALWGYAVFAVMMAGLIVLKPAVIRVLLHRYELFAKIFLVCLPVVMALHFFRGDLVPRWPGSGVPIVHVKPGDALVHLGSITAFWLAFRDRRVALPWILVLVGCVGLAGALNRGGLLAVLGAVGVAFLFRPPGRTGWRIASVTVVALMILAFTDVEVSIPGRERTVSFGQFVSAIDSIRMDGASRQRDGTSAWRLQWWREIADYTFNGPYFWTGKGFGVNLADDDGFQVLSDGSLRSPHNGHVTMLARAGVPGLALWVAVQLLWVIGILGALLKCERLKRERWASVFLFLLASWCAFMINATFDVFIEGPMGGIWFWTVFGVGIGALNVHRSNPDLLGVG